MSSNLPLPDDKLRLKILFDKIESCIVELSGLHRTLDTALDLKEKARAHNRWASPEFDELRVAYERDLNDRIHRFSSQTSLVGRYIGNEAVQELSAILIKVSRSLNNSEKNMDEHVFECKVASVLKEYREAVDDFERWLRHLRELRDRVFDRLGPRDDPVDETVQPPGSSKRTEGLEVKEPEVRGGRIPAKEAERMVAEWFRRKAHLKSEDISIRMIHRDIGLPLSSIQRLGVWKDFEAARKKGKTPRARRVTNAKDFVIENAEDTTSRLSAHEFASLKEEYFRSIDFGDKTEFDARSYEDQESILMLWDEQCRDA